jgi:hypothetical protein
MKPVRSINTGDAFDSQREEHLLIDGRCNSLAAVISADV